MQPAPEDAPSAASRTLITYLLSALPPGDLHPVRGDTGLPAGAVQSPANRLIVAATPQMAPIHDEAALRSARREACDVAVIRHGPAPERRTRVLVDLVLDLAGVPLLLSDLAFYRQASGSLHLVSQRDDLFIAPGRHGLQASPMAPWATHAERREGLERAAVEIARACRRHLTG